MIARVLEPEVMDSPEEASDYDAMDHSGVNRVFVADFLAGWDGQGPILDVGTGTAQIPIEFCRQSSAGEVVAVDLAEAMLAVARRNVESAGLTGRVWLQLANGRALPFADGRFPAVISNSIVHHIPQPRNVFAEMIRVAQIGGTLFVRDLLRPGDEAELLQIVGLYADGANDHQRRMFAESLHAALTLDEVRSIVGEWEFGPDSVRQTSDRHWTFRAIKG